MFCRRWCARWQKPPVLFDFNSMSWFLCETRNSLRNFSRRSFLRRHRCRRSGFRRNNGTIFNSRFVAHPSARNPVDYVATSSQTFSYNNSFTRLYYERLDVLLTSIFRCGIPIWVIATFLFEARSVVRYIAGEIGILMVIPLEIQLYCDK